MTPEIEALVEKLLPQARSEAWRRYQAAPQQLELDELVSLASQGLAMAGARWETYCASRGFDPGAVQYFPAYALRRMRGAMLDSMRSADWVTRSVRGRAKQLRAAGQDLGATEEELTAQTGLDAKQIRDTLAAVSRRPVSMDAEPVDVVEAHDVEGQALVNSVLDAVVAALCRLPWEVQAVIALRYHQGHELKEISGILKLPEEEITRCHEQGVLAIHAAMAGMVSGSS